MTSIIVFTALAVALPYFFLFTPTGISRTNKLRSLTTVLLLLHTLYILYSIIVLPPPNIFSQLEIPLGTPTETIRNLFHETVDASSFPRSIEQLLTRIGSFETRTLYVRFGHDVVATCDYCHSYNDFAYYALPGVLLSYIREAAILGLVTIKGTQRERYRTLAVGALLCVALAEGYWLSTVSIEIPKDNISQRAGGKASNGVIMWHDILYQIRHIIFLILPLAIHFFLRPTLPQAQVTAQTPLSPFAAHQITTLQNLITRLQLLKYTRASISRSPVLQEHAQEYWQREREEGEWVRGDGAVRDVARRVGLGFDEVVEVKVEEEEGSQSGVLDEGVAVDERNKKKQQKQKEDTRAAAKPSEGAKLRRGVQEAVKGLLNGFVPSDYWKPADPSTQGS